MFRTVSITCFIIVLVSVAIHCLASRPKLTALCSKKARRKPSLIGVLRTLVYLLGLVCFAVLLVTGFAPRLVLAKPISGYWSIVHVTAAPVFVVCVAVLAVIWAHNCRLDKNYWPWLQRILQRKTPNKAAPQKRELAQKICFWLIILLVLPLALSVIVCMFPLFGTHWQKFFAGTHRYCALLVALLVIIHTYLMILTQANKMAAK